MQLVPANDLRLVQPGRSLQHLRAARLLAGHAASHDARPQLAPGASRTDRSGSDQLTYRTPLRAGTRGLIKLLNLAGPNASANAERA